MSQSESIAALIICCIDYRFVTQLRTFTQEQNLIDKYDLLAFPGASKNIHQLFDAIEISIKLHKPKKIIIMDHEDCGAFGENNTFLDHKKSLERAIKLIKIGFPKIFVELYYITFSAVKRI